MSSVEENTLDVSVVIGFKDWGADRLLLAVRMLEGALRGVNYEVIVADYGSRETSVRNEVVALGARYVYTETDGVWSRSRALNSGFEVANGRVLIATDADMVFSPGSLAKVTQLVLGSPNTAVVLQCRDLPSAYGAENIGADPDSVNWRALERASRLRPRWGMGGMMAVSRESFARIRGLDERMVIYGGEDMDFAQRLQRSGTRIHWIDDVQVRMYHVWHEPSRQAASETPEGEAAVRVNRDIFLNDPTMVRNVTSWRHRLPNQPPLATIVVTTHNRANHIGDSINSILAQSVSDFELLILDDGSTDETAEVVRSFEDSRIRYVWQENSGVANARNHAVDLTDSPYTVIMDDDDLMLPWRLEAHFSALRPGVAGTYGGWIDFDDEDGSMVGRPGKDASLGSLLLTGGVYAHATLMLRTDVLKRIRYDETLRSGADYMLGVKLMRSGLELVHTGKYHIMRRLHGHQLTGHDTGVQKNSAVLANLWARNAAKSAGVARLRQAAKAVEPHPTDGSESLDKNFHRYLPDHLVRRTVASVSRSSRGGSVGTLVDAASWADVAKLRREAELVEFLPDGPTAGSALSDEFFQRLIADAGRPSSVGVQFAKIVHRTDSGDQTSFVANPVPDEVQTAQELEDYLRADPAECFVGKWDASLVPELETSESINEVGAR